MRLVLTNATLIDCIDPNPVARASVVVEDGRIAEITSGGRSPSGDGSAGDRPGRRLPASRTVGRPHSPRLRERPQRHRGPADCPFRPEPDARHGRVRRGRRPVRRRGPLHGRGLAGHLRLGRPGRPASVRQRNLPHHHRRPLPHLRARPRVRRPLRFRQRGDGSRSRTAWTTSS